MEDGSWIVWFVIWIGDLELFEKKKWFIGGKFVEKDLGIVLYFFMVYGMIIRFIFEKIFIKNVMVWINENDGILVNMDVLLEDGKIVWIGKNLLVRGVKIIDGIGKYLICGIIDEYMYIGGGGNEVVINFVMVCIGD